MANGLADTAGSLRLFRAFGIDVYVHWSWFIIAAFMYQFFGAPNPPWFIAVYLSLFGIVVLHEYGHALACRSVGGFVKHIVLWPLGGVAFVRPPERPGPTLWTLAAGPLVNVALVPVTYLLWRAFGGGVTELPNPNLLGSYLWALMSMNLVLLIFNMMPIYPLDGGQIFQSVLWFIIGRARSIWIAAGTGMVLAVVLGALALAVREWLILVIAMFILMQAWNGIRYARYLAAQEGGRG
ncbi:MAG: site-2 protease family protein [Phycisphaeraceae bacterium]